MHVALQRLMFPAAQVISPAELAVKSDRYAELLRREKSLKKDPAKLAGLREELAATKRELEGARMIVDDTPGKPPESIDEYRKYAAAKLGIPERELSPEVARKLRAQEVAARESASAPFRKLLPNAPITDRASARKYFKATYQEIGALAKARSKPRVDNDPPMVREAKAKAEKNIGAEVRDLVFRLRSTTLNGLSPEMDGSEKPLADVFEEARYAEALALKTSSVVENEASARFFEMAQKMRGTIVLGSAAEDVYESTKNRLRALLPGASNK